MIANIRRATACDIAATQPPVEQLMDKTKTKTRQGGIVTRPLVPEKRVLPVYFDPLELRAHFFEPRVYAETAFEGNVRILAAPYMQELTPYFAGARQ